MEEKKRAINLILEKEKQRGNIDSKINQAALKDLIG